MKIDKEERIRRAEELFVSGYNCSQAVVAAFADLFGFTEEQGLKLSAGMGGGMGRLRMTCGAVSGMAILAGMDCGSADASDREGKSANYKVVQELCERFKSEHQSLICAELLNIRKGAPLSVRRNTTRPALASIWLSPPQKSLPTIWTRRSDNRTLQKGKKTYGKLILQ